PFRVTLNKEKIMENVQFSNGDVWPPNTGEFDMATAGIDITRGPGDTHFSAIECHATTEAKASEIRSLVMSGLQLVQSESFQKHIEDLNNLLFLINKDKDGDYFICGSDDEAEKLIDRIGNFAVSFNKP